MHDPKSPEHLATELSRELRELFADACENRRYGWKRCKLDDQQREYIIQREAALQAAQTLVRISWQSIDLSNQELALTIRENALHSLATLIRAMALNEDRMIE